MKRRDFVKAGLCLGCAGALGSYGLIKKNQSIPDNLKDFMYKSEKDLPKSIIFDLCNKCQLNCPACLIRQNEEQVKKNGGFGYTSFQKFKEFIDKNPFINDIEIALHGEVLLNPDLEKILEYAYEKKVRLHTNIGVNLNTISESLAEAIVKYELEAMTVSIDGASPETYAIYRRGGDFNKVIDNIKMINRFKKQYNSNHPYLTYKFILFGHNEHEILKAKELAKSLNMQILFTPNGQPDYSPIKNKEKVLKETGLANLDTLIETQADLYKNDFDNGFFCKEFYDKPTINFNGKLAGCAANFFKSYEIDVFKDGLFKALNKERVLYAKYMLSDLSAKPRKDVPCSQCRVYEFLKQKNIPITNKKFYYSSAPLQS